MKHALSRVCGALFAAPLVLAPMAASAQEIHYRSADGINTTPVSAANPLPVAGSFTGSSASVGTSGSTAPTSSDLIGTKDGSGNLQPASSANPIPVIDSQLHTDVTSPIPQACTGNIPISQTASTDLKTGTGKIYICSIKITAGDAENLSLVEGTGTVCATSTVALDGATTAANGNQIAANGGWAEVSPTYMFSTSVTGNHLCLLQSGTGRVAGHITYSDH